MGFSDTWHRTLVYFGLAEDHDSYDDQGEPDPRDSEAELESRYRERPNVRRLQSRRRRDEIDDIFADDAPSALGAFIARCPVTVSGLMTMPPFAEDPEASRPHFAALRELAAEHGLERLSMGTSQDYRVAAEEGATIVRVGSLLYS